MAEETNENNKEVNNEEVIKLAETLKARGLPLTMSDSLELARKILSDKNINIKNSSSLDSGIKVIPEKISIVNSKNVIENYSEDYDITMENKTLNELMNMLNIETIQSIIEEDNQEIKNEQINDLKIKEDDNYDNEYDKLSEEELIKKENKYDNIKDKEEDYGNTKNNFEIKEIIDKIEENNDIDIYEIKGTID